MKVHIMSFLFTQFGSIDYSEQEIDRCIGILKVELQTKVREDFTITERAPSMQTELLVFASVIQIHGYPHCLGGRLA